MSWIIYKHTNKINGKVYIGQTNKPLAERWGSNGCNYSPDYPFGKAIKKYKWDNFDHEVLVSDIATIDEANQQEIYYIKKFHSYVGFKNSNGYNATLGGDNREDLGIPIYQIDKNLNIVKKYKSITEAVNETGLISINGCFYSNQLTAGGYYWVKETDYKPNWKPRKREMGPREVYQIDPDTLSIVARFKTIKDASVHLHCSNTQIHSCCNKKLNTAGGFYWCYCEDFPNFTKPATNERPVLQISISDLKIIKRFKNVADAVRSINGCFTFIDNVCLRKKRQAYGFYWCFADEYSETWKPVEVKTNFRGKSQKKRVVCITTGEQFESASEAARHENINPSCIIRAIQRNQNANGKKWKYIDKK